MAEPTAVTIERLGAQGDGLAHADGRRLIVPFALPGEVVSVGAWVRRGDAASASAAEIQQPSPHRIEPICPHFGTCGGCSMQHAASAFFTTWRSGLVAEALAHAGLAAPIAPAIRAWGSGRRRTRLAALRLFGGRVVLGYHRRRDRQIVDIRACPQVAPPLFALAAPLRQAMARVLKQREGADVAVSMTESGLDVLLVGPKALPLDARLALTALAEAEDLARISWQPAEREPPETVAQRRLPVVHFGGCPVALPPDAFLQATAEAEAAMVGFAAAAFAGRRHVADLYAGCGAFALPLTAVARVTAYEAAPAMVAALDQAARLAQISGRLTVERRDLERRPLQPAELKAFDGVLLDPPRAGAANQCATLAGSAVPLVVMASCYPPSFARDARTLVDGGYRLVAVQPVDQFGWSHHVELISRFER
ncbi:MAG: class I SAM-dependent RNA methyltransferase [Alphaproteobacteria bacterium]